MKAIKTIVATAVIVFALTTVAMAGVQRLSGSGHAGDDGQTSTATLQAAHAVVAQPTGGVTLSSRQFAALLHAIGHAAANDGRRDRAHSHDRDQTREHDRQQGRTHSQSGGASAAVTTASHRTTTHHTTTRHTTHNAATHGGGTHDGGTHTGGPHAGGHDGGCD